MCQMQKINIFLKGGGGGWGVKIGVGWAQKTKQLHGFANERALENTALRKNMARSMETNVLEHQKHLSIIR